MKRTAATARLRRLGRAGLLAALCLGPFAPGPAAPEQGRKRDKDVSAEKAKKERREDGPPAGKPLPEAGPAFTLHGGFAHGVLLRRQGQVHQLALLRLPSDGAQPQDYRVRIDWGDHREATRGQLLGQGPGRYSVAGRHVYTATGRYTVRVCVTGPDGTTAVTASGIEVGDLYAGVQEEWTPAAFPAPAGGGDDFQALVDWGDGPPSSAGLVRRDGEVLRVRACHAYALDGPCAVSVLVTDGGGVRGGHVYGASDRHGAHPQDRPVHPYDLVATVYHALGIDPATRYRDALDRPRGLVEHGAPVVGVF